MHLGPSFLRNIRPGSSSPALQKCALLFYATCLYRLDWPLLREFVPLPPAKKGWPPIKPNPGSEDIGKTSIAWAPWLVYRHRRVGNSDIFFLAAWCWTKLWRKLNPGRSFLDQQGMSVSHLHFAKAHLLNSDSPISRPKCVESPNLFYTWQKFTGGLEFRQRKQRGRIVQWFPKGEAYATTIFLCYLFLAGLASASASCLLIRVARRWQMLELKLKSRVFVYCWTFAMPTH